MKNLSLFLALVTAVSSAAPSLAQGYANSKIRRTQPMVNTSNLEQVEYYHSPLRFQNVNENPILTDHTGPERTSPRYIFVAQPQGGSANGVTVMGGNNGIAAGGIPVIVPAGGAPPMRRNIPGVAPLDNLPASRFDSNIPSGPGPLASRTLPNGGTTNLLAGRMAPPAEHSANTVVFKAPPNITPTPFNAAPPPVVASYGSYKGATGSSQRSSIEVVSGRMIRQHLLNNSK